MNGPFTCLRHAGQACRRHAWGPAKSQPNVGVGRRPRRPAPHVIRENGQVVQVLPLTVKLVGEALLFVQVPWNPSVTDPPAAMVPL